MKQLEGALRKSKGIVVNIKEQSANAKKPSQEHNNNF